MLRSLLLCLSLLPLLALGQQTPTASAAAAAATTAQAANTGYNGGNDNPVDPSTAGAAGSDNGAFNLSKGALAAIIVVVVFVVVGGIASAILFWLAKKRQWDVRQSIRRASRRFTGRSDVSTKRQNRRTGVRLNSPPRPARRQPDDSDLEKGLTSGGQKGKTTTTISSTFDVDTPASKGWKAPRLGANK